MKTTLESAPISVCRCLTYPSRIFHIHPNSIRKPLSPDLSATTNPRVRSDSWIASISKDLVLTEESFSGFSRRKAKRAEKRQPGRRCQSSSCGGYHVSFSMTRESKVCLCTLAILECRSSRPTFRQCRLERHLLVLPVFVSPASNRLHGRVGL